MALIAFGVLVCAYGEMNLVIKGLVLQLSALAFEVRSLQAACTYCGSSHLLTRWNTSSWGACWSPLRYC